MSSSRSTRIPVGDPESDAPGVGGCQGLSLVPVTRPRLPERRGRRARWSRLAHAERLAAAHDGNQAALFRDEAAADRAVAALQRHQAALDRVACDAGELTGALRQGCGFPALQREIDRCRRAGSALVLGLVDVDGLKAINDTHGHLAGDIVLRMVSAHLRASLRAYDVMVRFGGDEFVHSLADTELEIAEARFDQVLAALGDAAPGHSASAGFAQMRREDTLGELVARANADMRRRRRHRHRRSQGRPPGTAQTRGGRDQHVPAHPAVQ